MALSFIEKVRARLLDRRADWTQISVDTEIDRSTIQRIANGATPSPRVDTVEILAAWMSKHPARASKAKSEPVSPPHEAAA